MASPGEEFTLESVRDFMILRGGRVTNHELVQRFKSFLTHTDNKEVARNQFKQYVNVLSNIVVEDENKYLVLKKKYRIGTPVSESGYLNRSGESDDSHHRSSGNAGYASPGYSPNVSSGGNFSPAAAAPPHGNAQYGGPMSPNEQFMHQSQMSNSQPDYQLLQQQTVHNYQHPMHHSSHSNQSTPPSVSRQNSYSGHAQHPAHAHSYAQQNEPPAPPLPPRSQQQSPASFGSSPQPYTPPRYRAPPPYRPPPGPMRTPPDPNTRQYQSSPQGPTFPTPQFHNNQPPSATSGASMQHQSATPPPLHPKYNSPHSRHEQQPMNAEQYRDHYQRSDSSHSDDYRVNSMAIPTYNEPLDLGIPPAPVQSIRSSTRGNGAASPMNTSTNLPQTSRPSMLPVQPMPSLENVPLSASYGSTVVPPGAELQQLRSTKSKSKSHVPPNMVPLSQLQNIGNSSASATPSPVGDGSASESPVAPQRKPKNDKENKENYRSSLTNSGSSGSRQDSPSDSSTGGGGDDSDGRAVGLPHARPGDEKKVSVKEKTQIFNRMASETNLLDRQQKGSGKSNRGSRAERDYDDNVTILSYGQDGQDWLVAAASSDFNEILRLLKIHPELMRRKDRSNGYTALHWAAKHGRVEVVKLLAGTHQADPNARSNGGYTPLHLAAIYSRPDVFDLLVHYGSELNMRDYSGKKPHQYNTIASSTISPEHQKRIVQRRNSIKDSASFLRIGSLNVKVRRTTEAFNSLLSRDSSSDHSSALKHLHKNFGSSDSLPEDRESNLGSSKLMPPPIFGPMKKRKMKKERHEQATTHMLSRPASSPLFSSLSSSLSSSLASLSSMNQNNGGNKAGGGSTGSTPSSSTVATPNTTPTRILPPPPSRQLPVTPFYSAPPQRRHHHNNDSDSDNACGFGTEWR